jgi:methanogenic corrinoid protein MtbC1
LLEHYVPALLAGERQAVFDVVVEEGIGRGVTVPEIYLHVIKPALYRIGRLWEERRIGVAEEHIATDLSRQVLAHLYPFLPCTRGIGKATVVACVEGELHEVGAHMIADFLEMGGFDVRFVGANVPTRSLVALVHEREPHLLALSVTYAAHIPALRATVAAMREAVGSRVVLAAGGQALEGVANELDIEIWGGDAYSVVAAARRALRA